MRQFILTLMFFLASVSFAEAAMDSSERGVESRRLLPAPSDTAVLAGDPKVVVEQAVLALLQEIKTNKNIYVDGSGQLESLVESTVLPIMDTRSITRVIAADHWPLASKDQKEQFHHYVKNIIVSAYAKVFAFYDGQGVRFFDAKFNANGQKSIVRSEVILANFMSLNVDYKLKRIDRRWFVYDVRMESTSVLKSLRSQYLNLAELKGVDGLLEVLRADSMRVDVLLAKANENSLLRTQAVAAKARASDAPVQTEPLRIVVNSWFSSNGQASDGGVVTALVTAALKRAGYQSSIKLVPWRKGLKGVKDGVYDALVFMGGRERDRGQLIFSKPYHQHKLKLIARWDDHLLHRKVNDFKQLTLEKLADLSDDRGYLNAELMERISELSVLKSLKRVAMNQLDFIVVDEQKARLAMKGSGVESSLTILPGTIAVEDIRLAVSKRNVNHQEIVLAFNEALDAMIEDGSYQEIIAKYAVESESGAGLFKSTTGVDTFGQL